VTIEDDKVPITTLRAASGRKPAHESRATEFRQRLIAWKQSPESLRLSLRALARELGTSHQLLEHYLEGLEEWRCRERYLRAKQRAQEKAEEIRARAEAEGKEMTMREAIDAIITPGLLDQLEELRQEAKRGPLHRLQFKMLEIYAKQGFREAQELLARRQEIGVKGKKRFAEIVKETPRLEGEADVAWVRRIWDECAKYETNCPQVITIELLEKWSRRGLKKLRSNLPAIPSGAAKSFRTT
jgi:hypothetical protein